MKTIYLIVIKKSRLLISTIIRHLHPNAPKSIIWDISNWITQYNQRNGISRAENPPCFNVEVEKESHHLAKLKKCNSATCEDVVLDVDISKFSNRFSSNVEYYSIAGAAVLGPEGVIISPDRKVFSQLNDNSGRCNENTIFRRFRFPKAQFLRGNVVSLVQPLSGNYYHWILETLPTIQALRGALSTIDTFLIPEKLSAFHHESLAAVGIPKSKIRSLLTTDFYICERLHAITFRSAWVLSDRYPIWLKKQVQPNPRGPIIGNRWYVSRSDASSRRAKNEVDALHILEQYGFKSILMSSLSFIEQADIFDKAEAIVSIHGAGLTNLIFCQREAEILEIFPPKWTPLCYFGLSQLVGCNYTFLTGSKSGKSLCEIEEERRHLPESDAAQWADFDIPIDRLKSYLSKTFDKR